MVGATVQYTELELSNLASNWRLERWEISNLIGKIISVKWT